MSWHSRSIAAFLLILLPLVVATASGPVIVCLGGADQTATVAPEDGCDHPHGESSTPLAPGEHHDCLCVDVELSIPSTAGGPNRPLVEALAGPASGFAVLEPSVAEAVRRSTGGYVGCRNVPFDPGGQQHLQRLATTRLLV